MRLNPASLNVRLRGATGEARAKRIGINGPVKTWGATDKVRGKTGKTEPEDTTKAVPPTLKPRNAAGEVRAKRFQGVQLNLCR